MNYHDGGIDGERIARSIQSLLEGILLNLDSDQNPDSKRDVRR
jgi:hypothetical protein